MLKKKVVKLALILSLLGVMISCGQYKKRFGGRSGDYEQAHATHELIKPSNSLAASDRYAIPDLSEAKKIEEADLLPPDYQTQE